MAIPVLTVCDDSWSFCDNPSQGSFREQPRWVMGRVGVRLYIALNRTWGWGAPGLSLFGAPGGVSARTLATEWRYVD